jgi:hypothetical protein
MTYFHDSREIGHLLTAVFERFFASEDGVRVRELASSLPVSPVLSLYVTRPDATLSIDLGEGRVSAGSAAEASVRLEIEADVLHDVLLERLDPVQLSRPFEEDRAVIEGAPEALLALIRVAGMLPPFYRQTLAELGLAELLEMPAPETATIWTSEGPPRRVIGRRRPWQRPLPRAAPTP